MIKLVLVQPFYHNIWDALGLAYIGSYVTAYCDQELEVNFYQCFFDSDDEVVKGCEDADIVGFSCVTPTLRHGFQLATKIKDVNPHVWTVFGGWGPSAQPEATVKHSQIDQVVVGEGEEMMLEVVKGNRDPVLQANPVQNLNSLPWPDRQLIKVERTIALTEKNDRERITSVQGGRGCPFHCVFCSEALISQRNIRRRSVKQVVDEIEFITDRYRLDLVKFVDPELNPVRRWVKDFCREIVRRKIDVEFEANLHSANVDFEMLQLMKKARFRQVDIGVETGSPKILKEIGKGTNVELIVKCFDLARKAGLRRRAYFLIGMRNETLADVDLTFKLADKIDADIYGMSILCPFPGCDLYDKKLYGDVDWSAQNEYTNNFYRTRCFSNEELRAMQAEFTEKFKDRLCFRQKGESG